MAAGYRAGFLLNHAQRTFSLKTSQIINASSAHHEWKFGDVDDSEIEACYVYEYAREFACRFNQISNLLEKSRNSQVVGPPINEEAENVSPAFRQLIKIMEACLPDFPPLILFEERFPNVPWQTLDQEFRRKVARELQNGARHQYKASGLDAFSILMRKELEEMKREGISIRLAEDTFIKEDLENTEVGNIAINFDYTNTEIKEAFSKWLSQYRKDREADGVLDRQSSGFHTRLKWLGALRRGTYDGGGPYTHPNDFYKYKKQALELLNQMLERARPQ
jgi:hypothetical protein